MMHYQRWTLNVSGLSGQCLWMEGPLQREMRLLFQMVHQPWYVCQMCSSCLPICACRWHRFVHLHGIEMALQAIIEQYVGGVHTSPAQGPCERNLQGPGPTSTLIGLFQFWLRSRKRFCHARH